MFERKDISGMSDAIRMQYAKDHKREFSVVRKIGAAPFSVRCTGWLFGYSEELNDKKADKEIRKIQKRSRSITAPFKGDIAIYFNGSRWEHAGLVVDPSSQSRSEPLIRSKWGTEGVYDHSASFVPGEYGEIHYFRLSPLRRTKYALKRRLRMY